MLKILCASFLLTTALSGMASPIEPSMTMKERLRLSFWVEGIQTQPKQVKAPIHPVLPEEIERPLRKL